MSRASGCRVFLLLPSFQPNDAIGNDVFEQYRTLTRAGYPTRIFADYFDPSYDGVAERAQAEDELWNDREAVLIYHHSIHWETGERIVERSKNKVVIKHHNVTPPEYFAPYAQNYYWSCVAGVAATERLARMRIDFVWGDSRFNVMDFRKLGVSEERCRVIPPMHHVETLGKTPLDAVVLGKYLGETPNILFVGGFRPNKGHIRAVETFAAYRRLAGGRARLLLVGGMDPAFRGYVEDIMEYAQRLNVEDSVFLAQSVSLSQLRAYYATASVFLCVSDHEGFCVPLVEAMYFRVPIVGWARAAVGETCNGCGHLFQEFDPRSLALAIDECVVNPSATRASVDKGRQRYEMEYCPDVLERRTLDLLQEVEAL